MDMNNVVLNGTLAKDPELRKTRSGTHIMEITIVVDERVQAKEEGKWVMRPSFICCTMYGSRAEHLALRLHKGARVAIEGKLRYTRWTRGGQVRDKLEVVIDELEYMSIPAKVKPASIADELVKCGKLLEDGIITREEYEDLKARLLKLRV